MAQSNALYARVSRILESARTNLARTVNTTQVVANWLIGREIIEAEQHGKRRADYGKRLILDLSAKLTRKFGRGYSAQNLFYLRQFYSCYPDLLPVDILHALRGKSEPKTRISSLEVILHSPRGESGPHPIWVPGRLSPNLSWTHYRTLLKVDRPEARAFYEIESIKNSWSARELERQIASLLFDRLAKSRDKQGLMRLATKGQEIAVAADAFKDPVVMEFIGLPAQSQLVETDLEQALIGNL